MGGAISPGSCVQKCLCGGKGKRRVFQGRSQESEHLSSCSAVLGGDRGCAGGLASGGCAKNREFEIEVQGLFVANPQPRN